MKKYMMLSGILVLMAFSLGHADVPTAAALAKSDRLLQLNMNTVWTLIAAAMVFFMQAGFAMVESGFSRAKNTVNIMMKNLMDFCVASVVFYLVGFGLMFGQTNGLFGTTYFAPSLDVFGAKDWLWTFLIFQTVFAGTAATIVSGAMAERTRFGSYLLYSFLISGLIYPVFGSWAWGSLLAGSGWLERLGFVDFAGSTVVHSIGGWLALAGAMTLGPRLGKYNPDGSSNAIPGHNIALGALGVFILWFGWFGFNPGSTTFADGEIGLIAINTNLAGAAGGIAAMATAWLIERKPEASMTFNGALAGLVAITAGCASVTPLGAVTIGFIAGVLVVLSVFYLDRTLKIDDPVGAVSVHGVCGAFGTLAVGLFSTKGGLLYGGGIRLLAVQSFGVATAFAWAFGLGILIFKGIAKTIGLRVGPEEELRGLDIGEHGMEAYNGFQIFTTQ